MDEYETLNHTTWDCKYHVVFIPKYRRKLLFQELRKPLGKVFRQLAAQKEAKVEDSQGSHKSAREVGPIDVLVTNIRYGHEGVLEESSVGDLQRQFDARGIANPIAPVRRHVARAIRADTKQRRPSVAGYGRTANNRFGSRKKKLKR